MHRLAAALIAAILATAPAAAQTGAAPADPGPEAVAFAQQFSDNHLSGMLSRIGMQNAALRALAEFDSRAVATVFDAQIDAAVRQYGGQWAHNMALAWEPLLSDAEMSSLVEKGAGSPHTDKYLARREAAAARMAELSSELFGQILQEVVIATVATLSPDTPAAETPVK